MIRNNHLEKKKGAVSTAFIFLFVAALFAAGVGAGLIITSSDESAEKAEDQLDDTSETVSKLLQVEGVTGDTDSSNQVETLNITVRGGSGNIDLESTTIRYLDDEGSQQLTYSSSGTSDTEFTAEAVSDEDGSLPIINSDQDLVKLEVQLNGTGTPANLQGGDEFEFDITTDSGATRTKDIQVPDFVPSDTSIKLD